MPRGRPRQFEHKVSTMVYLPYEMWHFVKVHKYNFSQLLREKIKEKMEEFEKGRW